MGLANGECTEIVVLIGKTIIDQWVLRGTLLWDTQMKFALCCFLLNLNSVWHQITVVQSRSLLLKIHLHRYRYIDSRHSKHKHPPRRSDFSEVPWQLWGRSNPLRSQRNPRWWRCCTLAAMPNRGCPGSWPLGWVKCEFLEDQEVGIVSTMGDFGDLISPRRPRASFLGAGVFLKICRLPNPINPIPFIVSKWFGISGQTHNLTRP